MIGGQFPLPYDFCNIRGTLGQKEVIPQLHTGLPLIPEPIQRRFHGQIDQNVNNDKDISQQTKRNVDEDLFELLLPGLRDIALNCVLFTVLELDEH